jgi:hypothetical protein
MDFQHFFRICSLLAEAQTSNGFHSYIKMVPFERTESENTFDEYKKPRMAAVMMLFYQEWDDTFWFLIVRNS